MTTRHIKSTFVKSALGAVAVLGMMAVPAAAQSVNAFDQDRREVHLGVTIPFGSTGQTQAEKPKLQLGLRDYSRQGSHNWALSPLAGQDFQEHTFGLTLSEDPAVMINGRELVLNEEERLGLGTTETILIGAGVVLLAIIVATAIDCSERSDNTIVDVCP